jgi:uncharacterized surface protein with fasciclin (FAS1) repeats
MTTRIHIAPALAGLAAAMIAAAALVAGSSAPRAEAAPAASKNIVQTAVAAGQFKTLVALVKKAGLAGALSGSGKLTVFAPTDAAFKKVPKATLARLGRDRALLKSVLLYHAAKGNLRAAQVAKLTSAPTLNGKRVRISVRNGSLYLNSSSRVTKADVAASNGTIHVIDRVLIPPSS